MDPAISFSVSYRMTVSPARHDPGSVPDADGALVRGSLPRHIRMTIGGCPAPRLELLGLDHLSSLMGQGHPLPGWLSSGGSAAS